MTESRLDTIYRLRQLGVTLREIGGYFGISRERVRQLLVRHYGSAQPGGLLTAAELARLIGCRQDYIIRLKRRGIIQPVKAGQSHSLWPPETIATIIIYNDRNPPVCRICHRLLPAGRWVFCSDACSIEGSKFKNRPRAVKERQNERVKKWLKAHPEQAKAIWRRAGEKRYAKRKGVGGVDTVVDKTLI